MPKKSNSLAARLRKWLGVNFDTLFALREKTHLWLQQLIAEAAGFLSQPKTHRQIQTFLPQVEPLEIRLMPFGSKFSFASATQSVYEDQTQVVATVDLTPGYVSTATVNYVTSDDTAIAGTDYTSTSGTLTFAPGDTSHTISIPILNYSEATSVSFLVSLSSPSSGTSLTTPYTDTITIIQPPTVQFSASSYSANEADRTATISATLSNSWDQTATVNYATSDGSATAGSDYTSESGTITFSPGLTTQTFTVPITDEGVAGSDKTVDLALSSPSNTALGSPDTATLTIHYATPTTYLPIATMGPVSPADPSQLSVGSGNVNLLTGNLHVDLPAAQDYSSLEQDDLYYYPGLEYNSDTADPQPILGASIPTQSTDPIPTDIKATLTWNGGTPQTTVTFSLPVGSGVGDTYDLTLQVASPVTTTGIYTYSIAIQLDYSSGGSIQRTLSGTAFVIANNGTPYGYGWAPADENYLVFNVGHVLMVHADGGYSYFTSTGGGTYSGPAYDAGTLTSSGSTYTYTDANKLQWNYNSSGKLVGVVDPVGVTVAYSYDGSGRLSSVLDPDNNEVEFAYSGSGLLSTITRGYVTSSVFYGYATTTTDYDSSNNLTAVIDPEGNTRTFIYDGDHKLTSDSDGSAAYSYTDGAVNGVDQGSGLSTTSVTPQLIQAMGTTAVISSSFDAEIAAGSGGTIKEQLDAAGNDLLMTLPSGATNSATFNSANLPLTTTDAYGNVTSYTYVSGTQEVASMDTPGGLTTTYAYGISSDQPTQMIDGYGNTTTFDYDSYGDLTETINPDGSTSKATFSAGLMQTSVDALGKTTLYDYDGNRRVTASIDPLGATTLYSYDLATGAVTTVSPDGITSVANYNGDGQLASQIDGTGRTTTPFYDANGNVTATMDTLGHTSFQDYDAANRMTASVDANGVTTREMYDAANQVTATVDGNGKTAFTYYDSSGNVTASVDALGRTTQQEYDSAGDVTATVDALGKTSLQDYSSSGLMTASVDALGRTTLYDYDSNRRLTATVDANGHTTQQIYDSLGNVTATVDGAGATAYQFYDLAGNVTASVNADGKTSYQDYNAANEMTASVDADGHTSFTMYDANGNVTASVDANGHTSLTYYDPAGQVTATVNALGKTSYQDYDLDGRVTAAVDANGHTAFTLYDNAGQVTATVDALGKTAFTDYDPGGRVTATVDTLGHTSFTLYDGNGNVTETIDAAGHTALTFYDAAGQVTATVDGLGKTSYQDYDLDGRVTASVDANGKTSFTDYDAAGQVTASVDANGHSSFTDYDAVGNVTATIDGNGHTSRQYYDADNRVTESIDGTGATTFQIYDAAGQVTASVSGNGKTSFTDYDPNGQVTATVNALGKTALSYFDADGQVTASVDANGHTSFARYDAIGEVTATVDADGFTSLTMFDAAGNVTETIDANGYVTHDYYDADNRLTQLVNNSGQTASYLYDAAGDATYTVDVNGMSTQMSYDADGNVTLSVNSLGNTTQQGYDADNRVTMTIDGDHNTTRQLYDADGQVTASVDGRGYTSFQQYDADGNVTATIDQDGDTTLFKFDADGNNTAVIDPDLNTTVMAYEADGRVTETISPTAGTALQYYDADGNLTETIAADNSSIVQSYDADDRVTQALWYNPSHSVIDTQNKTYDNDGDLLTASNVNGTYSFSYDPDNRVTQVSEPFGQTLSYAYDGDGNQTQVVDSFGGTQTSFYDVQDRLVTRDYTGESQTLRVDFLYTPEGQIAQQTDYDSLLGPSYPASLVAVTGNSFDADENVTAVLSTNASTATIDQFVYTLDQAGNISSEIDTQGGAPTTTSYSYDDANQLTGAGGSSYNYDANGNRDSTGYTTTLGNEMTSDGTYNYTYDAKGNELTKTDIATGDNWTYGYNNANEMTSAVEETSGSVVEQTVAFKYDIFGNMLEEDVTVGMTTTTTRYAYDGWNPAKAGATGTSNFDVWAVFNSLGSLTSRQLQGDGIDKHLAYVESSNAYWYLTDHLGSMRTVIDNSGAVQDSLVYDACGNITYQTPSPSTAPLYSYTGRELDVETGLQYSRARWYDASTGRWISQDPMGFDAGDSNLYRYVNNQPTVAVDPSGLEIVAYSESTAKEMQLWLANDMNGYWQQPGPGLQTTIAKIGDRYFLIPSDMSQVKAIQAKVAWKDDRYVKALGSPSDNVSIWWEKEANGKWTCYRGTPTVTNEEEFQATALRNGMPQAQLTAVIETMKGIVANLPDGPNFWLFSGDHSICGDAVNTFDRDLAKAMAALSPTKSSTIPGVTKAERVIFDIPVGAKGNTVRDVYRESAVGLAPTVFLAADVFPCFGIHLHLGAPSVFGTVYNQDHTATRWTFTDGSVWYIDVGMIQAVLHGGTANDIHNGINYFTPASELPKGWIERK